MRFVLSFLITLMYLYSQPVQFDYQGNESKCKCSKGDNIIDDLQAVIESDTITDERYLACCYHCLGVQYYRKNEYLRANKQYEKAIELRTANNDNQLAKSYRNFGYSQKESGLFDEAIVSIGKAIEESDIEKNRLNNHRYLGNCYTSIGEFEKAKKSFDVALKLVTSDYEEAELNNTISIFYIQNESFEEAIEYAEKAIPLYQKAEATEGIARTYNNKGNAHMFLAKYEEAIQSYNFALNIYRKEGSVIKEAQTLNNIATALYQQKKHQKAITTLNQSLQLKKKHYNDTPYRYTYAANYENLAENYEALGNVDKALQNYQLVLINCTDNFRNEDINTNPKVTNNLYIYNKPDLLRVLDLKAQAALKNDNIDLAHDTYQVLDEWINEFYKDLSTDESKLTWIARTHATYTHAIAVALKKNNQAKAFEYAEKARAVLLWQSHSQQAALSLLNDIEREKYDNLLAQIQQADNDYRNATDENKPALKDSIDMRKRQFNQFEKTLSKTNPEYAQRKYQPKKITLKDVQTNILNNNTALIEYHWSADDLLYIFTLTKNEIYVDTIAIDAQFNHWIEQFAEALKNSSSNATDVTTSGYEIYQTVFANAASHLDDNIKKIILIPDGKLNYIPFEALPTAPENDLLSTPYLIDNYEFNYLYSCGSYGKSDRTKSLQIALIIAPEFGKKDTQAPLESKAIVAQLQRQYPNALALTGTQPTREAVIRQMLDADMIHIAAHAEQGTKGKAKIHLYAGDELNQNDIQASSLKARHVVLSACETGTGELSQGEGVLSLGWSFVYCGVPSVVMSLWKVNDASTGKLMESYYQLLNEKIPADEALRQAKLQLKSSADAYQHPYHWAAFIHTGNPPTKEFGQNALGYLYVVGGLLALFFIVYLVITKNKKESSFRTLM